VKNLKDALELAGKDPEFAQQLIRNPEQFKVEYNMTDAQVEQIRTIGPDSGVLAAGAAPEDYESVVHAG
jgi:hypothetical protein